MLRDTIAEDAHYEALYLKSFNENFHKVLYNIRFARLFVVLKNRATDDDAAKVHVGNRSF